MQAVDAGIKAPKQAKVSQLISIWFVFAIGICLAFVALVSLRGLQEEHMNEAFLDHAEDISFVFDQQLSHEVESLYKLKGVFQINRDLNWEEFKLYSNQLTRFQPALRALTWQPMIEVPQISAYENRAKAEGLENYTIWQSAAYDAGLRRQNQLGDKTYALPVLYISPLEPNSRFLGFDTLSDPGLSKIYRGAINSGEATASGQVRYRANENDQIGFFIALAVFEDQLKPSTNTSRSEQVIGVISGAYAIESFMENVLGNLLDDMKLSLFDTTLESDEHIIFANDFDYIETSAKGQDPQKFTEISAMEGLIYKSSFEVGGHRWEMYIQPSNQFTSVYFGPMPWLVFSFILLLTLICAFYLRTILRSRAIIAHRVNQQVSVIRENEKKLIEMNNELEEFAYRTSHDLRSPIISSSRLLKVVRDAIATNNTEMAFTGLSHAQNSLAKLEQLIVDILSITEAGKKEEDAQIIDIDQAVENVLSKLDNLHGFSRLKFNYDFNFEGSLIAKPSRFNLILENLVSNAIKYQDHNKDTSYITIRTSRLDKNYVLEVEDNGLGVPQEQEDQLFKMFRRFHPKVAVGSGLGLYLMQKSAAVLNGKIHYVRKENTTLFRLTLPMPHIT